MFFWRKLKEKNTNKQLLHCHRLVVKKIFQLKPSDPNRANYWQQVHGTNTLAGVLDQRVCTRPLCTTAGGGLGKFGSQVSPR